MVNDHTLPGKQNGHMTSPSVPLSPPEREGGGGLVGRIGGGGAGACGEG